MIIRLGEIKSTLDTLVCNSTIVSSGSDENVTQASPTVYASIGELSTSAGFTLGQNQLVLFTRVGVGIPRARSSQGSAGADVAISTILYYGSSWKWQFSSYINESS